MVREKSLQGIKLYILYIIFGPGKESLFKKVVILNDSFKKT